jgi:hypothetical protein
LCPGRKLLDEMLAGGVGNYSESPAAGLRAVLDMWMLASADDLVMSNACTSRLPPLTNQLVYFHTKSYAYVLTCKCSPFCSQKIMCQNAAAAM